MVIIGCIVILWLPDGQVGEWNKNRDGNENEKVPKSSLGIRAPERISVNYSIFTQIDVLTISTFNDAIQLT